MTTFIIIETAEYRVQADTAEQAEELFLDNGPSLGSESPVTFQGVNERSIEPAVDIRTARA